MPLALLRAWMAPFSNRLSLHQCTSWFLLATLVVCFMGTSALAGSVSKKKLKLRPAWVQLSVADWSPNFSILAGTARYTNPQITDGLIDSAVIPQIRQKYEVLERTWDDRKNAGLLAPNDEQDQFTQKQDLTHEVQAEVRRVQTNKMVVTAKSAVAKNEKVQKTVTLAVGLAAAGTGAPMDADLGRETRIRASANLPYQASYLQIFSPLGTSSFTYSGSTTAGSSLFLPPPKWIARDERFSFSFARTLPIWELGSGVSYLGTSNAISASLSKTVAPHLVATVSSIYPVDTDISRYKAAEETLRFSYELRF